MRFSARQQHCLNAMGIVPWVSRHAAEVVEVAEVAASAFTLAVEASAQPPESAARLGEWVLSRALVPIHYRGSEFPVLGAAEATVLVIVEQTGSQPATAALEGDSSTVVHGVSDLRAAGPGQVMSVTSMPSGLPA